MRTSTISHAQHLYCRPSKKILDYGAGFPVISGVDRSEGTVLPSVSGVRKAPNHSLRYDRHTGGFLYSPINRNGQTSYSCQGRGMAVHSKPGGFVMSYQDRAVRPLAQAPSPNSPSKPLPPWIVGLITLAAFWLIESLCYLIDTWRW